MRVGLVDDEEIVIEGLKAMLAPYRSFVEVVATALFSEDVASHAAQAGAEVVLVDVHRPATGGMDQVAKLMAEQPRFRVVIFTGAEDERQVAEALRLGAAGYLLKSMTGEALAQYLVRARSGEVVIDPTMASRLALGAALHPQRPWPGSELGLTNRQSEVLGCLSDGLSNAEIASKLVLGKETVKTHLRDLYRVLGVSDRVQAVALALRRGIFT